MNAVGNVWIHASLDIEGVERIDIESSPRQLENASLFQRHW